MDNCNASKVRCNKKVGSTFFFFAITKISESKSGGDAAVGFTTKSMSRNLLPRPEVCFPATSTWSPPRLLYRVL